MKFKVPVWAAVLAAGLAFTSVARASQVWAEVGDGRLRADLQLLEDSGLIDLPLSDWPIPVADIVHSMSRVDPGKITVPALREAYRRVEQAIEPDLAEGWHIDSVGLAGGEPGLLRDFDTPARENGDASVGVADSGNRWAVELNMTYAANPRDGQPLRLDGSNITARFGNWLVSLNTLDKWWGPGQESSLILSNNARPMPALVLERATSEPFRSPLLHWLGPWRFILYFATAEQNRPDVRDSLFFGNRISFRPLPFLELAVSRTTQFCGSGRACNFTVFRNVLVGNDTTQYSGVTSKPGHAQAGYEARLSSPWHALPLAVYTQIIGNDEIHRLPGRLMKQYGIESWLELHNGDTIHGFAEYTDSTCGAGRSPPEYSFFGSAYPCAYHNSVFFAGYTYRGLNIGDSAGANSILRTFGLRWDRSAGDEWQLKIQSGHFDRGDLSYPYDLVSPTGSSLYDSVQVEYRRRLFGGELSVQLGAERQKPAEAVGDGRGFGYVSWHKGL